jgi:hypothetical protein
MDAFSENDILTTVEAWASLHPHPNNPVLNGKYTPRQIANELRARTPSGERTPTGQKLMNLIEKGVQDHSLDEVLSWFTWKGQAQRGRAAKSG